MYFPNPHMPDELLSVFVAWWTPGQYQWPELFMYIVGNRSHAIMLSTILALAIGVWGWVRLWKLAGFSHTWILLLILILHRNFYWHVLLYMGGDVLLFAVLPHFFMAVLRGKNFWIQLPFWLLVGFWAKASFYLRDIGTPENPILQVMARQKGEGPDRIVYPFEKLYDVLGRIHGDMSKHAGSKKTFEMVSLNRIIIIIVINIIIIIVIIAIIIIIISAIIIIVINTIIIIIIIINITFIIFICFIYINFIIFKFIKFIIYFILYIIYFILIY